MSRSRETPCIYIFLLFVVNNKDHYKVNYDIHSVNPRQISNLHQPLFNLTYQNWTYYFDIKTSNNLPREIKKFSQC